MDSVSDSLETDVKIKHMNAILKILLAAHKKTIQIDYRPLKLALMLILSCYLSFLILNSDKARVPLSRTKSQFAQWPAAPKEQRN